MDILHSLAFHGVIKISFKPPYLNTAMLSQAVLHLPNLLDLTPKKEIQTAQKFTLTIAPLWKYLIFGSVNYGEIWNRLFAKCLQPRNFFFKYIL